MKSTFMKIALVIFVVILSGVGTMASAQSGLPKRSEIDNKYKWNLADVYKTEADWETDYNWVKSQLVNFSKFKGKLAQSSNMIAECYKFDFELQKKISTLYIYAALGKDTDLKNDKYQAYYERISKLNSDYSAAASFISPEMIAIPKATIDGYIKTNKDLASYKQLFDDLYRQKDHMLSAREEEIIAKMTPIGSIPRNAYMILNDAELPFPKVEGLDGKQIQISHGRYRAALYSNDRAYRARVYKGTYEPYNKLKGTFATLYNGRVKTRLIDAELRGYKSPVEASLAQNNVPVSVYENLVATANKRSKTLHRLAALKKKVLGVKELHPYDSYASLFSSTHKKYSYEEAVKIVLEALKPLGEKYQTVLKEGFENRWIDVYETDAKRSGAYSNNTGCGPHPFILLNWNNTIDDMFTLAHELGHNMHSWFSEKNQPFHYSGYSIFVAEVASITNEALLLDYLIEHASSKEEKLALYEKFLVNAQSTFFRQTRFAEFEKTVHDIALTGKIMSADELTKLFAKIYKNYWGPDMVVDYEEGLSWSRIPHLFKYNFYVFQYATGFAAAQALSQQIKKEGQPAIDRYLEFLSSGNSDYPINVLKKAGVDMSTPKPIEQTIDKMDEYLDELEKLVK